MIRSRRVKCDETKPACKRCSKLNIACAGYPATAQTYKPRQLQPRRSLSLSPRQCHRTLPDRSKSPSLSMSPTQQFVLRQVGSDGFFSRGLPPATLSPHLGSSSLFTSPEQQHFHWYMQSVTVTTTQPPPLHPGCAFWHKMIGQTSYYEPYMRYVIITLASLKMLSLSQPIPSESIGTIPNVHTNPRYQFAVEQYGKAMRTLCSKGERDLVKLLMVCGVVTYLEHLWGNYEGAKRNSSFGRILVKEWMKQTENKHIEEANGLLRILEGITGKSGSRRLLHPVYNCPVKPHQRKCYTCTVDL